MYPHTHTHLHTHTHARTHTRMHAHAHKHTHTHTHTSAHIHLHLTTQEAATVGGLLDQVEMIGAKLTSALDALKDTGKNIGQPASLGF